MAQKPLSDQQCRDALQAYETARFSLSAAARLIDLPRPTLENRIAEAKRRGMVDAGKVMAEVRRLQRALTEAQQQSVGQAEIRSEIIRLKGAVEEFDPPEWTLKERKSDDSPGVPTLFLSDLHWGEVVKASQIMGKNQYNLSIAHERLRTVVETALMLLKIISPKMDYPGIVLPLGGDMISGNIHDELAATNELNTMPTVLDLFGALVKVVTHLADTFGAVFLPCVGGNHGRDTHKIWAKDRNHTSFDWLMYCFLAKHFEGDKRVQFYIPDGPDAYFRIYNHRYLLTHGDQFRGGDGLIGALGPLIRGDHKKRSRNAQIDMEYDTMCCGHWHQDIFLRRLIVNSSLKGYDEYAFSNNFPFEVPSQQLWITHQRHRITFRMPVYASREREAPRTSWASVTA